MESGYWLVSVDRAVAMIGHPIHFHRAKVEVAFLSGIVTNYRREPYTTKKGNTSPRTVFIFTPGPEGLGAQVTASSDGWTPAGVKYTS